MAVNVLAHRWGIPLGMSSTPFFMRLNSIIVSIILLLTLSTVASAQQQNNPKEEALDIMTYSAVWEFGNVVSFGFAGDVMREASMSFSDDHLLYRGVVISPLSSAQKQGLAVGRLLGMVTAVAAWGIILFAIWYFRVKRRLSPRLRQRMIWIPVVTIFLLLLFYKFLSNRLENAVSQNSLVQSITKATMADACIAEKLKVGVLGDIATHECITEIGMTAEEAKALVIRTIEMADEMSISERLAWCKVYLPHFYDPSTVDAGCTYLANNWPEMRAKLLMQLNQKP